MADEPPANELPPVPDQTAIEPSDEVETVEGEIEETIERVIARLHMGPLPDVEDLAGYEAILPGLANRITVMAEQEQRFRHRNADGTRRGEFVLGLIGQAFGLAVALFGLWVAYRLGVSGKAVAATTVAAVDLVALATVFVIGRSGFLSN